MMTSESLKGVLFALYYAPKHEIRGKVIVNKVLARLELEGVKLPFIFKKFTMGSCIKDLQDTFVEGVDAGFITLNKLHSRTTNFRPRLDVTITNKGLEEIKPLLNNYFGEANPLKLTEIIQKIESMPSKRASQEEHKQLILDDAVELEKKCKYIFDQLLKIYAGISSEDFKKRELSEFRGFIQYVLFTINKIKLEYFNTTGDLSWGSMLDDTMSRFYVIKLAGDFLPVVERLNGAIKKNEWDDGCFEEMRRIYAIIKHIAVKYSLVESLSQLDKDRKYLDFK